MNFGREIQVVWKSASYQAPTSAAAPRLFLNALYFILVHSGLPQLLPVVLSLYLLHLTHNCVRSVYRREVTPGTATPCPDARQESINVSGTDGEGLYFSMLGHGLHFLPAPRKLLKTLGTLCCRNTRGCLWDFLL